MTPTILATETIGQSAIRKAREIELNRQYNIKKSGVIMTIGKFVLPALIIGSLLVVGTGTAFAATKIGTVTNRAGETLDKVQMTAEITNMIGRTVTVKDTADGKEYTTNLGPVSVSGEFKVGDTVTIEGATAPADNPMGMTFKTMKVNDTTIREDYNGRPSWAKGKGNGTGRCGKCMNQDAADTTATTSAN